MAILTIVFGVLLAAVGVGGYVETGSVHPTALIPCWIGLVLVVCGLLANTGDVKRRALWMHVAVDGGAAGLSGHDQGCDRHDAAGAWNGV